ncbi:hypothetical protein ACLQ3K_06690 [Tsukamurella sp. DT100]|uniref:hypothetical protein n=1 Tax=Tsukamurella sp. DT100 TaxID=3393415 RepID=UPI003CF4B455
MTTTIPEFTAEQLAEALHAATPVDQAAVQRSRATAEAALDAAFFRIRTEAP